MSKAEEKAKKQAEAAQAAIVEVLKKGDAAQSKAFASNWLTKGEAELIVAYLKGGGWTLDSAKRYLASMESFPHKKSADGFYPVPAPGFRILEPDQSFRFPAGAVVNSENAKKVESRLKNNLPLLSGVGTLRNPWATVTTAIVNHGLNRQKELGSDFWDSAAAVSSLALWEAVQNDYFAQPLPKPERMLYLLKNNGFASQISDVDSSVYKFAKAAGISVAAINKALLIGYMELVAFGGFAPSSRFSFLFASEPEPKATPTAPGKTAAPAKAKAKKPVTETVAKAPSPKAPKQSGEMPPPQDTGSSNTTTLILGAVGLATVLYLWAKD